MTAKYVGTYLIEGQLHFPAILWYGKWRNQSVDSNSIIIIAERPEAAHHYYFVEYG